MSFFRNINVVFVRVLGTALPVSNARKVETGKLSIWRTTDRSLENFCCLQLELIISKLNSYGFSLKALKLMNNYLSQRN